jgi:anti-anti-sigma factor
MAEYHLADGRLTVQGPLNTDEDAELRKWCLDLFLHDKEVVTVDMENVSRIDSRCIGVLATLWIDLSVVGRRFKLLPSSSVKRILDMSGLSQVFLRSNEE